MYFAQEEMSRTDFAAGGEKSTDKKEVLCKNLQLKLFGKSLLKCP